MAKRKTIGANPLDAIVPDPESGQQDKTSATPKARPPAPVPPATAGRPAQSDDTAGKPDKGITTPVQATRLQTPPQPDLLSRIQSLEEQNAWVKWVAYGAIVVALLL